MILKNDIMTLDIIAANDWKRPICWTVSSSPDAYQGLDDYLEITGMVARLTPFKNGQRNSMYPMTGKANTKLMLESADKYCWGGIQNNNVYLDETAMRMAVNLESNMGRLAEQLAEEGKKKEAIEVLDKCLKMMPKSEVPYTVYTIPFINTYYKAGAPEKAHAVADVLWQDAEKDAKVYFALPTDEIKGIYSRDMQEFLYAMQSITSFAQQNGDSTYFKKCEPVFTKYEMQFRQIMNQ